MTSYRSSRIESIDLLRGVVMVIMALDHVREYFHYGSFFNDPTDLKTTTAPLFFTRFITHFCAPVFVFLAGASAFLHGSGKTRKSLFRFLMTRGLWLILLEVVVNNFIWSFDFTYSYTAFQVIYSIGLGMIILSLLIFILSAAILAFGLILVFCHNTLDGIMMQGQDFKSILWYLLHQVNEVVFDENHAILFFYPVIPWCALMALGYVFGQLYHKDFDAERRKKWLLRLGSVITALFFLVRGLNIYGDPAPWSLQETAVKTVISFFNVNKYPPSLDFTLMTLGPAMLFLYAFENTKKRISDFFKVYGHVPLFYYFAHMLLIHSLAIIGILIFGGNWEYMILTAKSFLNRDLANYGYSLYAVYAIWISVVLLLYFPCKTYMQYKLANKDKWWLSYL